MEIKMITRKNDNKKNFIKLTRRRGISLIILVITIIVILILAAAVILTISNNNPVEEANKARYESDRANMQAVFTNTIAKVMAHNRAVVNVTAGQVNGVTSGVKETTGEVTYIVTDAMNSANTNGKVVFDKGTNTDTVFYIGKQLPIYAAGETKWYVDSEGRISLKVSGEKYGSGEIPFAVEVAEKASIYYGEKVINYETGNTTIDNQVDWQIYYADSNNIYLIASDYIHANICPPSANNEIYKNSDYKLSMNNVINDYNGSSDIIDMRLQALNNSYHKYLKEKNTISENDNMKAVAYMMDIDIWNIFKGSKAEYAIGGPTVEMLMKSYSQKYNKDYRTQVSSIKGYEISKNGGLNWAAAYSGILSTNDMQYRINTPDKKANGMWLASPSSYSGRYLMYTYYHGLVNGDSCISSDLGFRPIVCLKSNVTLKTVEEGYKIES